MIGRVALDRGMNAIVGQLRHLSNVYLNDVSVMLSC
jgi:predicted ATPase